MQPIIREQTSARFNTGFSVRFKAGYSVRFEGFSVWFKLGLSLWINVKIQDGVKYSF